MGLCHHGGPSWLGVWACTVFAAGGLRPNVSGVVSMARAPLLGWAGLCWRGEAVTCWASAHPGQEAPGCWAVWRCLPSVHSLYLSIKPFHPSSGPSGRFGGLSPAAVGGPCASSTSAYMSGWAQGEPRHPISLVPPSLHPASPSSLPAWALSQYCQPHPIAILSGCWCGTIPSLTVLPLWRFQPVSVLAPVREGGWSQDHLCGHHCLSW